MIRIFNKVSLFLFKDVIKLFEPKLKTLKNALKNASINQDVITYLSNALFLSFVFFLFFEFIAIFLLMFLKIYFDIISFLVTIFISMTFTTMFFLILYKYPYYLTMTKRQKLEKELQRSIKHLQVLKDPNMTVKDVLLLLQRLEFNDLLTKESKKILTMVNFNKNLRASLETVKNTTYSEIESDFFRKLINVIDKKESLQDALNEFLENVEQNIKEETEMRKTKTNLLFGVNLFLFLIVFILLSGTFFVSSNGVLLRQVLMGIAIAFPIIEIVLVIVLNK